jgi:transposase
MSLTVIGVDPHKRSHTAVVLDAAEEIAAQVHVLADRRQTDRLLAWANPWPQRIWAIENVHGMGKLLTQQLLRRGEQVVDVPTTLTHRTRRLSGQSGRKTDAHDARSVAIAAANPARLRAAELEDVTDVLGLLVARRWQLVSHRHQLICRTHAVLAELTPAGAKRRLTADDARRQLRRIGPVTMVDLERRRIVLDLLEEWRWIDRHLPDIETRIHDTLSVHGTTLTSIYGIGEIGAATMIAAVGDIGRFPSAGHFAAFNGTAPLEASSGDIHRHRLSRQGNRQLNAVLHIAAVTQIRHDTPGRTYYRRKLAEHKTPGEARRALKRQLSNVVYRHLLTDARAREAVRGGQTGTRLASA